MLNTGPRRYVEDAFAEWLAARCEVGPCFSDSVDRLFRNFKIDTAGEIYAPSVKRFSQLLRNSGFRPIQHPLGLRGKRGFAGLRYKGKLMIPTALTVIGPALYGCLWPSQLARDLAVNVHTLKHWAAGDGDMPPGVLPKLVALLQERANEIEELMKRFGN